MALHPFVLPTHRIRMNTRIDAILKTHRVFAVVGLSDNPFRTSHRIAMDLLEAGYTVIPVNPSIALWHGRVCYPDLRAIPVPVDVVNIFRRSEYVAPIVDDAIAIGAKAIWMQVGVIDPASAQRALAAGLDVVMDRCVSVELAMLE